MKVIWRQYEILFFSIITCIKIMGSVFGYTGITRQDAQLAFDAHNHNPHAIFGLLKNLVMPQVGLLLLLYGCYLVVNIVVISFVKSLKSEKKAAPVVRKTALSLLAVGLTAFILALGANIASYYAHPWYYNYGGFGLLAMFGYNEHPMVNTFAGFDRAITFAAVYLLYAAIRELVIAYLENPANTKYYRVLVVNRVVTFSVIYLSVPVLLATFNIVVGDPSESPFYIIYFAFVLPTALVLFSNIYWLFPVYQKISLLNASFIVRLLISTFLCTFPVVFFFIFLHAGWNFMMSWAVQLFITTPVSWLFWRQQKEKILQLRGIEKDLQKSKADLQFLRSQINPHFLFNTLNTLYGMALQENAGRTAEGIQKLGDMMRFMLHENNLDLIPMNREIEYLQNYIQLQKLRIQNSPDLVIEDNLGTQHCAHKIPPMLLVPLVENAFKHGISLAEKSWIKIILQCDDTQIHFTVVNSLHAKAANDPEKHNTGIGLKNVQERLGLLYPKRHHLEIKKVGGEFIVQMIIVP